jgi:two-component system phosphate regulon response regulator PhoB
MSDTSRTGVAVHKGPKQKVLIVDDEPDTVELISFNLKNAGFDIVSAADGAEALRKARSNAPDLIILDIMLPEIDGLHVCKLLQADPTTASIPIMMLTAKAGEVDRILGLELGARDYVTKPFSPRELVLRVRNLLSSKEGKSEEKTSFRFDELFIDVPRHLVTVNRRPVELTATEFRLLTLLAERRGRVQSREQLLQDVWHYDSIIDTRTVDTHMRRLREKLGKASRFLDTVRGVGYRFAEE